MATAPKTGTTGPTGKGNLVELPLQDYTNHQALLKLGRTLMGGTDAMRAMGKAYLPQEEGESDPKYTARLARTILVNTYKRTIQKLSGEVFSKDVSLDDDVPEEIQGYCEDVDLAGRNLSQFSRAVFDAAINDGVTHILVEYPTVTGKTIAQQREQGARPYFVHIRADSLIGWRHQVVKGKAVLTQARIKEDVEVPDGEYGIKIVQRIRVLTPGYFKVYELSDGGGWVDALNDDGTPMEGTTTLEEIPLVTIAFGEPMTRVTARPPLEDLAYLNLMHWQSSSDQRNILHFARLITFFGKCLDVDDKGVPIFGPNQLIHSSNPQADLKIVEHTGAAIEAGRNDLKDLEAAMALFGLTLMLPKSGNITATQTAVDSAENDSALQGMAKQLQHGLKQALQYMADWIGEPEGGGVMVNTDFQTALKGYEASVLVQAFQVGLLPRELVVEELKRRGVITQDVDFQDLLAQLKQDQENSPSLSGLFGTPGGNPSLGNIGGDDGTRTTTSTTTTTTTADKGAKG